MTITPVFLRELALDLAERGFYLTENLAGAVPVHGYNLRCNRCGTYGAMWTGVADGNARPGWGQLALCPVDMKAWDDEHRRHAEALRTFADGRRVNFEQPTRTGRR